MRLHGSTAEEREVSPNVKMKMNEGEGPGEYHDTVELVELWREAFAVNMLM